MIVGKPTSEEICMHKKLVGACLALTMGAGAGYALNAMAQAKPEDVIKYRKAVMNVQSWNMRPMAMMVKGQQPYDAQLFAWYAGVIQQTSHMLPDAFQAGSDKGDTKAKAEIWKDAGKFKAQLDRFASDTAALVSAARAGNLDAVKGPFGAVAKNCGGCHEAFRTK
jgi:cytochrome c556